MRVLFALLMVVIPAAAQNPLVRLVNASHPASSVFQVGDRFEVLVTGAPNQPVSVRTTMNGRTDWGPIIGSTDSTGRWSTAGQFEKSDFGSWHEVWTVGGKLASPAVQFSVSAPCLPGGRGMASSSGPHMVLTCETAEGRQSFSTPSASDSFRTPDGRLVPGRSIGQETQDVYQMGILQELITAQGQSTDPVSLRSSRGGRGDETAELITNLIGVNALSEGEIRNVLSIIRSAFAKTGNPRARGKLPGPNIEASAASGGFHRRQQPAAADRRNTGIRSDPMNWTPGIESTRNDGPRRALRKLACKAYREP